MRARILPLLFTIILPSSGTVLATQEALSKYWLNKRVKNLGQVLWPAVAEGNAVPFPLGSSSEVTIFHLWYRLLYLWYILERSL